MNKKRLIIYLCLSMFLLGFTNVKAENDIMPLYDADTDSGNGSGGGSNNRVTGTLNVSTLGAFYINKSQLDSLGTSDNYYFKFTFYPLNSAYAYLDTQVPTSIYLGSDFLSVPVEVLNNQVADSLGYVLPSRHNIFSGSGCDITSPDNIEVINYSYSSNLALTIYGTFTSILNASKIYVGCGNNNGEFICINGHYYKGYFDIGNYNEGNIDNTLFSRIIITDQFITTPYFLNNGTVNGIYDIDRWVYKNPLEMMNKLVENGKSNTNEWVACVEGTTNYSLSSTRTYYGRTIFPWTVGGNLRCIEFSEPLTDEHLLNNRAYFSLTGNSSIPDPKYKSFQNIYTTDALYSESTTGTWKIKVDCENISLNPNLNAYVKDGDFYFYLSDGKLWKNDTKTQLYTDLKFPTIITPDNIPDNLPDVVPDSPEQEQPDIDIDLDEVIERLDTIITNQDTIIDILNKQIDEMQKAPLCNHSKMEGFLESILDRLDKLLNNDEPENNIIVNVFTPNEKDVGNFVFEINEIMDSNTSILSYPFSVFYKVINSFASATGSGSSINSNEYQQAYLNLKNSFNDSDSEIDSQYFIDDTFNEGSVISGSKINHVLAYPDMKVFNQVVIPSGTIDFDDLVINRFNGLYTTYMIIIKGMIAFSLVRFLYKKGREFLS